MPTLNDLTPLEMMRTVEAFRRVELWTASKLPIGQKVQAWRNQGNSQPVSQRAGARTHRQPGGRLSASDALADSEKVRQLVSTLVTLRSRPSWSRNPAVIREVNSVTEALIGQHASQRGRVGALAELARSLRADGGQGDAAQEQSPSLETSRASSYFGSAGADGPVGVPGSRQVVRALRTLHSMPQFERALFPLHQSAAGAYGVRMAGADLMQIGALLAHAATVGARVLKNFAIYVVTAPLFAAGLMVRSSAAVTSTPSPAELSETSTPTADGGLGASAHSTEGSTPSSPELLAAGPLPVSRVASPRPSEMEVGHHELTVTTPALSVVVEENESGLPTSPAASTVSGSWSASSMSSFDDARSSAAMDSPLAALASFSFHRASPAADAAAAWYAAPQGSPAIGPSQTGSPAASVASPGLFGLGSPAASDFGSAESTQHDRSLPAQVLNWPAPRTSTAFSPFSEPCWGLSTDSVPVLPSSPSEPSERAASPRWNSPLEAPVASPSALAVMAPSNTSSSKLTLAVLRNDARGARRSLFPLLMNHGALVQQSITVGWYLMRRLPIGTSR